MFRPGDCAKKDPRHRRTQPLRCVGARGGRGGGDRTALQDGGRGNRCAVGGGRRAEVEGPLVQVTENEMA